MLSKVWDKHTFTLKTSLRGHTGSILALELAVEKGWLFSASGRSRRTIIVVFLAAWPGDSTVRVCLSLLVDGLLLIRKSGLVHSDLSTSLHLESLS